MKNLSRFPHESNEIAHSQPAAQKKENDEKSSSL